MTDKYQRIRNALAMGPTPGPFFVSNGSDVFTLLGATNAQGTHSDEDDGWHVADCFGGETYVNGELVPLTYSESKANAHLFAACDPDTIRGLLAERDALQAECEALRAEVERLRTDGASAVRWAPSSSHWSEVLRELFGPNARDGIDATEARLHEERARAERLAEALDDAARSMRTISKKAGIDESMSEMYSVRGYAESRAWCAEEALAAFKQGGGE